jgi:outer membrane protein OmpU
MNNLKKIGLSALAGSLAAFTANAAEMSVSGSAKMTYKNGDTSEVTGNPYGMNTSLGFTGSGDVNGYETTLFMTMSDQMAGMSSASLAVDLGDMGTITFDQGVGVGGISTIDDKTPSANEEVWDGLDSGTGDSNGLVGGGNSGVFVYSNTLAGSNFSLQFGKGGSAANTDDATTEGTSGTSWDFALTNSSLVEGLDVGFGYGKIANASQDSAAGGDDANEHMTGYATYTMSGISVGYQESIISDNTDGGAPEQASGWGISATVMEGLSVSYGEREIEFQKASSAHVQEDQEGMAIAYTMGSAKISLQNNETSNNSGTANNNDEMTEIALSLTF